jgi:hypothetical protein
LRRDRCLTCTRLLLVYTHEVDHCFMSNCPATSRLPKHRLTHIQCSHVTQKGSTSHVCNTHKSQDRFLQAAISALLVSHNVDIQWSQPHTRRPMMSRAASQARLTGTEMFYSDMFFNSFGADFPSVRRMSAVVTPSGGCQDN